MIFMYLKMGLNGHVWSPHVLTQTPEVAEWFHYPYVSVSTIYVSMTTTWSVCDHVMTEPEWSEPLTYNPRATDVQTPLCLHNRWNDSHNITSVQAESAWSQTHCTLPIKYYCLPQVPQSSRRHLLDSRQPALLVQDGMPGDWVSSSTWHKRSGDVRILVLTSSASTSMQFTNLAEILSGEMNQFSASFIKFG